MEKVQTNPNHYLVASWVCFAIGWFMLGILFYPVGAYFAKKAERLAVGGSDIAFIANIIGIIVMIIIFITF